MFIYNHLHISVSIENIVDGVLLQNGPPFNIISPHFWMEVDEAPLDDDSNHKDYSKLLGMMTLSLLWNLKLSEE